MITTNHPPTVDFLIPTESAPTVVSLLLSNKISFKLTALTHIESAPEAVKSTGTLTASNHLEPTPQIAQPIEIKSTSSTYNTLSKKEMVFASIYKKYITPNMENTPPSKPQLAADFGISLTTLQKGFKAMYGKTFFQLYMDKKMEYAKGLILQGMNATNVSKRIGYASPIKFNLLFERYFGMSPKKYQVNHRNNPTNVDTH
jgi:AraC-like DNA-binding protein